MSGARAAFLLALGGAFGVAAVDAGCGGAKVDATAKAPSATVGKPTGAVDGDRWPKDDKTMCDWRNRTDVEYQESVGVGSTRPNIRRVFRVVGQGDARRKVLACREIDTNLDGIKDVARFFDAKGDPLREQADTNFDGKLDLWITFVEGQIATVEVDTNFDGKPDEWRTYSGGVLVRTKRDRNFDGKPDVWEYYVGGRLERRGVDETFDGRVDRWERDVAPVPVDAGVADGGPRDGSAPAEAGRPEAGARRNR